MIDPGAPLAQTQQWLQRKRWECVFQSYSFFFKSSSTCCNMTNATEKTHATSQKHPPLVEYTWEELWFPGKDNIEIAFMYSQCGEDWKQVGIQQIIVNEACFNFLVSPDIQISKKTPGWQVESSISGPLKPKEPLCCTNQGKFRRCDGSDFQATCGN